MGMCGGGGGGGETEFQWNDSIRPYLEQMLPQIQAAGGQQYQGYNGQRIAGLNGDQSTAMNSLRTFLGQEKNPYQAVNSAIDQTQATLDGNYLTGPGRSPYNRASSFSQQGNQYIGDTNPWRDAGNGYVGQTNQYANQGNQYIGESPYWQSVVNRGANDITQKYQQGTAADTNRMFALSGAYGGSAHQQAVANNQAGLGRNLSDYYAGMGNTNYDRSANLQGQDLQRMGSLTSDDLSRNTAANAQDLARHQQGWNDDLSRNVNAQEQDLTRRGGLDESFLQRGAGSYDAERNRMMQGIQYGNDQQGLALNRAGALSSIGDYQRNLTQQGLDQGYQDFLDQRDWGRNSLGWMGGQYAQTIGGAALPPNQSVAGAGNNWGNGLGSMLAAYGMFRG